MNSIEIRYGEISEEKMRRIIKVCAMTMMQHTDKSDSKLCQNKEGAMEFIFKSELAKKVGMRTAILETQFANFLCDYMIENKGVYSNLSTYGREKKLLEYMEEMGLITPLEMEQTKTVAEQAGNMTPGEQPREIAEQQSITTVKGQSKPEMIDEGSKKKIDLSQLNNPDLLLTNKKTGQKQIKYGRYSEAKRTPYKFNYQGTPIQITRVGRLQYKTSLMIISDIDEYLIQTPDEENEVFTYGLEMEKIESDEQYRKIFFEQLISPENINREGNNGYIGSIIETKDEEDQYRVDYSEEEYTAVTELKDRLDKMRADRETNDKDDR